MTILSVIVDEYNKEIDALNADWRALQQRRNALCVKLAQEKSSVTVRVKQIEMWEEAFVQKHPVLTCVGILLAMAVTFTLGTFWG